MNTIKKEIELPALPSGYEYTGEYRSPLKGELYVYYRYPFIEEALFDYEVSCFHIVKKVEETHQVKAERAKILAEIKSLTLRLEVLDGKH